WRRVASASATSLLVKTPLRRPEYQGTARDQGVEVRRGQANAGLSNDDDPQNCILTFPMSRVSGKRRGRPTGRSGGGTADAPGSEADERKRQALGGARSEGEARTTGRGGGPRRWMPRATPLVGRGSTVGGAVDCNTG